MVKNAKVIAIESSLFYIKIAYIHVPFAKIGINAKFV